ncbi:MAG: RagB/SusD family nutrient uptake outer membrane protein [Saprospiraceae bacterium]|nr:RagB/SusD family nutrient uptake outer membrane protein [Saprospiraceae bacterium]
MRKILILSSLILLAGGIWFACSEDFLDAPAQASLDEGTLANQAGVEAALISAYSMLDGWNNDWGTFNPPWATAGSNWIWGSVTSDDAYKGSDPGDQQEIQIIELFEWAPGNEYFNIKFQALYEGIARGNAALKLMANAEDISGPERIEGEVRFLRAHYHFDAWKMWKNVPYYTELDEDFRKPNNTDIIPQIIEDFQYGVSNLPVVAPNKGRATKGAAQSYLGKVMLYNGDFSGAKAQFDAVVNSGTYALQDCYHDIFTTEAESGLEHVFSIQASVNDGTGGGENGLFADRLNHPHGGSPFGCCGFHQASHNLVNAHKVDASGLPFLDKSYNNSDVTIDDVVDPRLDWTVGRDDVPFLDWGRHAPAWIRNRTWAGPFSHKKFIHKIGEISSVGWSNKQLSPVNIPIIRYADVLLMLAECEVEVGSLERAREIINMIRTRAGNCAQGADGGSAPIDDPGIDWATYAIGTYDSPWTDQATAREAVRFERRIEMAHEGHRYFDLLRWGIADEVINTDYLPVEKTKRNYLVPSPGYQSKNSMFPLPSVQIELSKVEGQAMLQQNPGY